MSEIINVDHLWKFISLLFSIGYYLIENQDITRVIVITLVLLCFFTIQNILENKAKQVRFHSKVTFLWLNRIYIAFSVVEIAILFLSDIMEFTPCALVIILSLVRYVKDDAMFYSISCIVVFLYINMESLNNIMILITVLMVISYLVYQSIARKLDFYRGQSLKQRQMLVELEERLKDKEHMMKTIRYATALEERNRMATRLHDKIGHNISGTILMLEASLLQMDKNPERAVEEINKAVEHLRDGVDDLRHALREERPIKSDINSSDIRVLLDQAKMEHGLHTVFKTDGDLEKITMELWSCIKENTTELLTNCLKHSKATVFTVQIKSLPSMIQVIYSDNGGCSPTFKKGLGLEAVEERTLKLNGRSFFEGGELGFRVSNIFVLGGTQK